MADLISIKGHQDWDFVEQPSKPNYNEGSRITSNDDLVWIIPDGGGNPITTVHAPCGYWTKDYVSPSPIIEIVRQSSVNEDDGRWVATFWLDYQNSTFGRSGALVNAFFRFPSIDIPKNALIHSAIITFTGRFDAALSGEPCNVDCYFNASDNAVVPIDEIEAEALSLTLGTQWFNIPVFSDGINYNTPDLKDSLQEIFSRAGWSSGNAIMAILKGNDSSALGGPPYAHRMVYDYYSDPSKMAILSVIYS